MGRPTSSSADPYHRPLTSPPRSGRLHRARQPGSPFANATYYARAGQRAPCLRFRAVLETFRDGVVPAWVSLAVKNGKSRASPDAATDRGPLEGSRNEKSC